MTKCLLVTIALIFGTSAFADVKYTGCNTAQQKQNAKNAVSMYEMINTWNTSGLRSLIANDLYLTFSCMPVNAVFCNANGMLVVQGGPSWDQLVAVVHQAVTPSTKFPDVYLKYSVTHVTCVGTDTAEVKGTEEGKVRGMSSAFKTDFVETWVAERNQNGTIGPQFHTVASYQQDEVTDPVFAAILNPPSN